VLEGLPLLFDFPVIALTRERLRGSLAVVVYHLLGDVINAAEHALTHYLPLTLTEEFLQNSSLGTPYYKWAKFTNDDFETLDECVRRLLPAAWNWYYDSSGEERRRSGTDKDAWNWFHQIKIQYASCVVDPSEPKLTVSGLSSVGRIDPVDRRFLNVWSRRRKEGFEQPPPIITKSVWDISDRSVITELQRSGLSRVTEMHRLYAELGEWLRSNCTIGEITASHRNTLSEGLLG